MMITKQYFFLILHKIYAPITDFYNNRKPCPWKVYSLKPQFYTVKLWFTGVYLLSLFLIQYIECGLSLEPRHRGGSNMYPQSVF